MDCLPRKVVAGEVPTHEFYEDEEIAAFHDIGPQALVHSLVIPKGYIPTLEHLTEAGWSLADHIFFTTQRLTREQGCEEGFRAVMNCNGFGRQAMHHIHMHMLGQRQMHWPPGWAPANATISQPVHNILLSAHFW